MVYICLNVFLFVSWILPRTLVSTFCPLFLYFGDKWCFHPAVKNISAKVRKFQPPQKPQWFQVLGIITKAFRSFSAELSSCCPVAEKKTFLLLFLFFNMLFE